MFYFPKTYRSLWYTEIMNTRLIAAVVTIFSLALVGFFTIHTSKTETFSAQSESDQSQDIQAEDAQQETALPPAEESRPDEVIDEVSPTADRVVEEKMIKQDTSTKEVVKEDVVKTPEETKTIKKLSGIQNKLVNFGFSVPSKPRVIDTIILHSSYNSLGKDPYSIDAIVDIYESYGVAAHYLIGRDGTIYRLVKDENIAYHAGMSQVPDGRKNVNDFSIGIEIVNTLDGEYTDAQYASTKELVGSLKEKYDTKYVLGHDDIAPGRKTDPWNFDWKKL